MIEITDKAKCCGCTACASICPKRCIEMKEDDEGFRYPVVNMNLCINCGICARVCPVLNPLSIEGKPAGSYVVRNKDEKILMQSSSGGFFFALCRYIIRHNGVIYGVKTNESLQIVHSRAEDLEGCLPFLGSKYVESQLGDVFLQVKNDLEHGKLVCFSGTPCQIKGLVSFLGKKDHDNLILVDIVCHGVSSEKVWNGYLDYERKKIHDDIVAVSFRSKQFGYNNSAMQIVGTKNRKYETARVNSYLKAFFSHIDLRPSCSVCPAKSLHHVSDFTIFDSWKAAEIINRKDDDKGYTNVLVQTEKALNIMCELEKYLEIYKVNYGKLMPKDGGMLLKSASAHPKRAGFMKYIIGNDYEHAVDTFIPISVKDAAIEKVKLMLRQSPTFRKTARLKRDLFRRK